MELGYRDNRGTRGHRYFTEFLPTWSTSSLERGWYQTTNATKVLPYSPVNLIPMGSIHASTIGALVGGNWNLSQGWGTSPQLNWRLPTNSTKASTCNTTNNLGLQEPKSKKLLNFHSPNPPERNQTDAPNENGKNTTKLFKYFSPKSTKSTKAYGGIREEEQCRKSTK